jgi:hypothetical protein
MSDHKSNTKHSKSRKGNTHNPTGMGQLTAWSTVSPVVPRLRTHMKYAETITASGLPFFEYLFNLNSLFDPNRTGVGHQPLGFDQLATLYEKYRVYNVRYIVRALSSTLDPVTFTTVSSNTSSGLATALVASEQAYAINCNKLVNAYNAGTISGDVNLATLNGKTHSQYAADDITSASISTSPIELLVLHVCLGNATGGNVAATAHVTLEFDCEWFDAFQLTSS